MSSTSRLLAPLTEAQSYRTLLYLFTAVPLGILGAAVLLAGGTVALAFLITPLIVPVLIAFRTALGWTAAAEAALVRTLLRIPIRSRSTTRGSRGFWSRAGDIIKDRAFWKQQVYLFLRFTIGGAFAIAEGALIASALGAIAMPISYHWSHESLNGWEVDAFWKAMVYVPVGVALLFVAAHLLRPLGAVWRALAHGLLDEDVAMARSPEQMAKLRPRVLVVHAGFYAALNGLLILIWAVTTRGYFWPMWTLIPLALPLGIHAWVEWVDRHPRFVARSQTRALAIHKGVYACFVVFFVFVWLASGAGYFWPMWPIIGLGVALLGHRAVVILRRVRHDEERIEVLESTRAGAVDQQESELRRIERDLHDGAQARLVALGMSLGMASQKLDEDPQAVRELLADAQRGAREALEELRDLARGIYPPVLADRGVGAAVATLADRNPLEVILSVDLPERPPAPVETACYFVIAEALANATKHADAKQVSIRVHSRDDKLLIEVVDDGKGGADPNGSGLTGLARRAQALDGKLELESPEGGPTILRAELPCA